MSQRRCLSSDGESKNCRRGGDVRLKRGLDKWKGTSFKKRKTKVKRGAMSKVDIRGGFRRPWCSG